MDVQQRVRSHYSREDLADVVLRAVAASGADLDHLRPEDLGSVDQLHLGGAAGTAHLLGRLALGPGTPVLDVGGGLGGPARAAASRWGCPSSASTSPPTSWPPPACSPSASGWPTGSSTGWARRSGPASGPAGSPGR